jgi:tetratricopeptide (TPR) repeat protein
MLRHSTLISLVLFAAACGGGQPTTGTSSAFLSGTEEGHFEAALESRRAGRLDEAEAHLQRTLEANPRYLAAHLALADLHYDRGAWHEARVAYRNALQLRDLSADAHIGVARSSLQLAEHDVALHHARRAAEVAGSYATAEIRGTCFLLEGQALLGLGESNAAADALARSLEADPANTMSRIQIARIRALGGDIPEAIRVLSRAESYETNPVMLRELGRLYFDLRLDTRAAEALDKAREANPTDSETVFLLSATQMRMGNRDLAIQLASDVITHAPDFLPAYVIRGRGELQRELFHRAREDANHVLTRDPRNFEAKLLLGDTALASGAPDQAEAHYREALQWSPGAIDGIQQLASFLREQGRLDEVTALIEPHVGTPFAPFVWKEWLAEAYLATGRTTDGIRLRSEVALADPSNGTLHRDVARLALDHPGSLDAETTLRHARLAVERTGGGTVDFRMLLYDALLAAGRTDEAATQLQAAIEAWPNHPEVQRRRGDTRGRR